MIPSLIPNSPILDWIIKKLTSKKLWVWAITVSAIYAAANSGGIDWAMATQLILQATAVYLGIEGFTDVSRAISDAIAIKKGKK